MPSRVGGVLALIAVALLGVALLVPWWSGHPTVDGKDTRLVEVDVTLFGGERCNTGGDGVCTRLPLVGGFKTLEAIELGAVGAAAALAAALALLSLTRAAARKGVARVALAGGAAVMVVGLILVATGPDIHVSQTVAVPTGFGGFVALLGGIAAIVASVYARKDDIIRPRMVAAQAAQMAPQPAAYPSSGAYAPAGYSPGGYPQSGSFSPNGYPQTGAYPPPPSGAYASPPTGPTPIPPAPTPGPPQAFDVQALLRDDALRPALPPSPGGGLPGPAGPIVPMSPAPSAPLFQSAPQLRPLYEMPGAGFVPPPAPPPLPMRAPTPISRAEFDSDDGALPSRLPPPKRMPSAAGRPSPTQPPPGSQGPPGTPNNSGAKRSTTPPPPNSFGSLASTALGVSPLPGSQAAAGSSPPSPPAMPALPPRVPPRPSVPPQPVIASPRHAGVPTPPPLAIPTPPPITMDDDEVESADSIDDERDDDDQDESSFDARQTYGLDPDGEPAADNTSPGLGIALEETPAAELLAPDDIETRGLRRVSARELNEPASPRDLEVDITTPRPRMALAETPLSTPIAGGSKADAFDSSDVHEVYRGSASRGARNADDAHDAHEDANEAAGSIDEEPSDITDDQEPVAPPPRPAKMPTPPPGTLDATPDAYASTLFAQSPLSPAAIAAAKAPVSTASQQLPPPKVIKTPPPTQGPSPACPQCESPMAWVEEHLRFYCRSCKMYF
jgi:hypothetical protein|nr:hypothetical protein [Kofleriaceae bacterium]